MIRKNFSRSLSFPLPASASKQQQVPKLKGVGSTTLPSRFNSTLSDLHLHVSSLLTWHHSRPHSPTATWLLDGLSRLQNLHSSLNHLLDPSATWPARSLDDFLRFADAYSSLRSALIALSHSHSATSSALRRNDQTKISSSLRSQRKAEKDLLRISSALKNVGKWNPATYSDVAAVTMKEVVLVTAASTAAVVAGFVAMSAGAVGGVVTSAASTACIVKLARKKREGDQENWKGSALKKMEELDVCIGQVEKRCEGLFRSLVNTRVILLNISTPHV